MWSEFWLKRKNAIRKSIKQKTNNKNEPKFAVTMAETIQLDASTFFSKVQKLHQQWSKVKSKLTLKIQYGDLRPRPAPCWPLSLPLVDSLEIRRLFGGLRQSQRRCYRAPWNTWISVSTQTPSINLGVSPPTRELSQGPVFEVLVWASLLWVYTVILTDFLRRMWLLHWEFSDTIIIMLKEKIIFGVSPKKGKSKNL